MEQNFIQTAIDYKKRVANRFVLVEGAALKQRIGGQHFYVTRKIDGHLQVVFFRDGKAFMLNSKGKEKASGLKCLDVFAGCLKKAGVKSATIAAELYLPVEGGRPRCGDVSAAIADDKKRDLLCLAPFDIIELDGETWTAGQYGDTHKKLCAIFSDKAVCPVEMRNASSSDEVKEIYGEWVEGEGAEGLVVHNEGSIVWKVKPRHQIDAAAIGYTTSERGIRSLMLAVRRDDGLFQMFTTGSGGLTEDDRAKLAERLSKLNVESQYVLSDSRGIAYQMVKPEIVFEISVIELVARGNDDNIRMNPLLRYDEAAGWILETTTPGVSALGVTIEKERTDKTPDATDIRISQLSDLCPFEELDDGTANLAASTLLERKVFRKVSGEKVMLHKFLIWKSNKEISNRFPAYVFYHTDFSSGRKEMIKRDMAYSSDEQQIRDIFAAEIASNVKKGWEEI